jgi:hypothetical protein
MAICLFLEFKPLIWFQKYSINPKTIEFLINKDKNRGMLLFTFPHPSSKKGNEGVSPMFYFIGKILPDGKRSSKMLMLVNFFQKIFFYRQIFHPI